MSELNAREWRFYVADMIKFAENVISYTSGFDQQRFENSGITYDATIRNLELIGRPPHIFHNTFAKDILPLCGA